MTGGAPAWWRARTPRERRLLLVMFGLLALLAVWLLVIRPLSDALDRAQRRHGEAVTALAEARARSEAASGARARPASRPGLPVEAMLGRTAAEAGFTGARIAGQGPGRATLAVDAARPQAFFAWVRLMERRGLAVESLRASANADRTLAVEAAFRARTG